MSERLSLRAAGRLVGCDHAHLARLVKNGRLKRGFDKLVDLEDVRKVLAQSDPSMKRKPVTERGDKPVTSHQRGHQSPTGITTDDEAREAVALISRILVEEGIAPDGDIDFPKARLAETILKARQRDLAIAERRKTLVLRAPVLEHAAKAFVAIKQAIQRMPARHAAEIAAELGCDVGRLTAALDRMIASTLDEMSAPVIRV